MSTKFGDLRCEVDGCDRQDHLYRTSPLGKGQPFLGRCGEHYDVEMSDPTTAEMVAIVNATNAYIDNDRVRPGRVPSE